jgi:hypothetical protein
VIAGHPSGFTEESSSEAWAWFTPRRFGVFLVALFFAEFPDVLLGFKTFAFRDFGLMALLLVRWRWEPGVWIVTLRRFLLVVLVVTGLAAAQLFPFLDLFRHSHREAGFAGSIWSLPPWGWANLIVPLFRTFRSSAGVFFQPGQSFTSS